MKKIIIAFALFISFNAKSQNLDTSYVSKKDFTAMQNSIVLAGKELKRYQSKHTSGVVLTLAGAGLAAAGASSGSGGVAIAGCSVSLIGFIIANFSAPGHIGKAGIILTKNGISIPLSK